MLLFLQKQPLLSTISSEQPNQPCIDQLVLLTPKMELEMYFLGVGEKMSEDFSQSEEQEEIGKFVLNNYITESQNGIVCDSILMSIYSHSSGTLNLQRL